MKEKDIERVGCAVVLAAISLALLTIGVALWSVIALVSWITSK